MLTRKKLGDMDEIEMLTEFERLVALRYPPGGDVGDRFAADFGITRPTYFAYKREGRIPWGIMYALSAWEEMAEPKDLERLPRIATTLREISLDLAAAAERLGQPDAGA